jgi:hypothetical protein
MTRSCLSRQDSVTAEDSGREDFDLILNSRNESKSLIEIEINPLARSFSLINPRSFDADSVPNDQPSSCSSCLSGERSGLYSVAENHIFARESSGYACTREPTTAIGAT